MALENLRILDLGQVFAAPYAAMILGGLGAEVIKVEPPEGDDGRAPGPPFQGLDSTIFFSSNWYKRGMVLDLKQARGQAVLARLISEADVLIHNYRPRVVVRLGLSYESLAAKNPRLVYCALSGFGSRGPFADRPGLDSIFQAMGGLASINGDPGSPPVRCGAPVADVSAGVYAAVGILAALLERERTGKGQKVELAMLDAVIALQAPLFAYAFAAHRPPARAGSDSQIAISSTFETKDRPLALSLIADKFWERFVAAVGASELAADVRFVSAASRMAHKPALYERLTALLRTRTAAEWMALLLPRGVPCSLVLSYEEVLADPQVAQNQIFMTARHADAGETGFVRGVDIPPRLSGSPRRAPKAPPRLGEDTWDVLRSAGYADADIAELEQAGIVRGHPAAVQKSDDS